MSKKVSRTKKGYIFHGGTVVNLAYIFNNATYDQPNIKDGSLSDSKIFYANICAKENETDEIREVPHARFYRRLITNVTLVKI
jgi:hypothetical protein